VSWIQRTATSPIGQKVLTALTGLGLVGFLVAHLLGNLNYFLGEEALNAYADALHHLPGFAVMELSLPVLFLLHIALVFSLVQRNRAARGTGYAMKATKQKGTQGRALVSSWMGTSGIILLVFLVVHIADIRMKRGSFDSLYAHVEGVLGVPWKAGLYMVGSAVVGWHLWHGFQSAFRSLGLGHKKYSPLLEKIGVVLSVALTVGFISIPLWILIKGGQ